MIQIYGEICTLIYDLIRTGILNKTICELSLYKIIGFRLRVESKKALNFLSATMCALVGKI